MSPQANAERLEALRKQVTGHPMCFKFHHIPEQNLYRVIFPQGDFPTHGAQAHYGRKCSQHTALTRLLDHMEKIWTR